MSSERQKPLIRPLFAPSVRPDWSWSRLDEIAEVYDCPHSTPKLVEDAAAPFVVRSQDVRTGAFLTETAAKVSLETYQDRIKRVEPRHGDLVYSREGTYFGIAAEVPKGIKVCLGQRMVLIRPDVPRVDHAFLKYWLNSPQIFGHIHGFRDGTVAERLNLPVIRGLAVAVPSLVAQREIAQVLAALDDRIALLRETNATLEAIAQALFKSWFVDFDPVRAKMEGRAPEGMDEAMAALFPDAFEESELGLVPRGWHYVSLREVVAIFDSRRIPLAGQDRAKRQGPYPYYGAAALMDSVDDYLFDGVYLLTGEDGSVADTQGYPITQYVWGKIWVNNHAHVLQGKDGVSTEHVMLFLKRTNVQPFITGAVQAKLSQSNMWRIMFLKPTRVISENFGALLEPLFTRFRHNAEQAQTLATLRDTLLPRLISGQLRLPDADTLMEGELA